MLDMAYSRDLMVERHLRGRGLRDERLLAAMGGMAPTRSSSDP